MRHLLAFSIYLLAFLTLSAQELTVRAPGRVEVGSRFEVRYEVNDRASDFRGPSFKGLSVLSGPMVSHQQGMTIINGQMSRNVSTGFTYIILADAEGTFNIGSASCNVDGKRVTCQGFSIRVEKGSTQVPQQNAYGGGQQRRQSAAQPAQSGSIDSKSLFARASISKNNPYQGEQVILTYKIYTQVSLSQYQIDKLPGNKGFWSEDITRDGAVRQYEETVDGRRYMVAEIRRGALFAQESGKLTIEPLDLDVLALVQRQRQRTGSIWDLFDDPFFNPTQAVEKHLRTNNINVHVKPLPEAPNGFNGAVGSFNVKAETDTREVRANEAITYRLTVSGAGNLMLIDAPAIEFPKVFEVYDPQINDHINRSSNGISGSRTFEWVLIPRNQGDYTLPAFSFVFFDPNTGRYVTKRVEAIPVHINKGDPKSMSSCSTAISTTSRPAPAALSPSASATASPGGSGHCCCSSLPAPLPPSSWDAATRLASRTSPVSACAAPPKWPAAVSKRPPHCSTPTTTTVSTKKSTRPSGDALPTNTISSSPASAATPSASALPRNRCPTSSRHASCTPSSRSIWHALLPATPLHANRKSTTKPCK